MIASNSETLPITEIAFGIDCDGCIQNVRYVFPFTSATVGDIKQNNSIIQCNQPLWNYIEQVAQSHPELEKITLFHFSARQDVWTDNVNSYRHKAESYYLMMQKCTQYLQALFDSKGKGVKVEHDKTLLADAYNNLNFGHCYDLAMSSICYDETHLGRIPDIQGHAKSYDDRTKISYLFFFAHYLKAQKIILIDDLEDIFKTLYAFFNHESGQQLIPNGKTVHCCYYYEGTLIHPNLFEFSGRGAEHPNFIPLLKAIKSKEESGQPVYPARDAGPDEIDRQRLIFLNLFRRYSGEYHRQPYSDGNPYSQFGPSQATQAQESEHNASSPDCGIS